MKEIHGVVCKKGGVLADNEMSVRVYDKENLIGLVTSTNDNPALTAEEARFLARQLNQAATRLEKRLVVK